ncbi:MAG TPA: hypothetical protein VI431_15165 [Candidatus Acidoferrum sp.]
MRDESTKQAAQEYLATKLTQEQQRYEDEQNRATAIARSIVVWRRLRDSLLAQCREWNAIVGQETLTCAETPMGDLRVRCAAPARLMTVHFDSRKLLVTIKNAGRLENEKDVVMRIEGYRTGPGLDAPRDAHLVSVLNDEAVNLDMLLLGELRVLTGMQRQRNP